MAVEIQAEIRREGVDVIARTLATEEAIPGNLEIQAYADVEEHGKHFAVTEAIRRLEHGLMELLGYEVSVYVETFDEVEG